MIRTCLVIVLVVVAALVAFGAVPHTMSYQGVLKDADGTVVPDGAYDMTLRLYDVPVGGTSLWEESQTVDVNDGIFDVILGSVAGGLGALAFDATYYLAVELDSGEELAPRTELTTAPYAFRAAVADSVDGTAGDSDWMIAGDDVYRMTGHVGLGTATPATDIHIYRETADTVGITIQNLNQNANSVSKVAFAGRWGDVAGMALYDDDGAYPDALIVSNDLAEGNLRFSTSGTERLRIDHVGNVGVGVASPTAKLDVDGTVRSTGLQLTTSPVPGHVLTSDASGMGSWQLVTDGLALPYEGTVTTSDEAFKITNLGTGSAGYFRLNNPGGSNAALFGWNSGAGDAVAGFTDGMGAAGYFTIYNVANDRAAVEANTYGTGPAIRASGVSSPAGEFNGEVGIDGKLGVSVDGSSETVRATASGTGTCGWFEITNGTNSSSAVYATSNGNGYAVRGTMTGSGYAGAFIATHPGSTLPALYAYTGGLGEAFYAQAGGLASVAARFRGNVVLESKDSGETILELGEGLDYAEGFDVSGGAAIEPGSVLVIDPENVGELTLATTAYDSRVAGIVAGANGVGSGVRLGAGQYELDVALAGRVYCNVDATNAAVAPGDLLTTSAIPGFAMKAVDRARAQGAILGKAMEPLDRGRKGQILVLVALQ